MLSAAPQGGRPISQEECDRRWAPWTLETVVERLGGVAGWAVVGGWALDVHVGRVTRQHADLEIAVPAASFGRIADVVDDLAWDVVGDGQLWPYPATLDDFHQTWLRDPVSGSFLLDVFRERHDDVTWTYRRDPSIGLPIDQAYLTAGNGLRYLAPEIVVLFKAKHCRPKDQQDFEMVVPVLEAHQRTRLRRWLEQTEPGHIWIDAL